jgi:hypothetical protein
MSKNPKVPSKTTKALGLGGAKTPTGLSGAAKNITSSVSKGKAPKPQGFTPTQPKSTERMKPTTPIIGANRGQGANFATVNKDRMNNTIKKLGM